jgi:4'-phosphopantetheinyl transferase
MIITDILTSSDWQTYDNSTVLPYHRTHVFRVCVSSLISRFETGSLLTEEEKIRGNRYLRQEDKNSFKVRRSVLKILIASLLSIPTDEVVFKSYNNKKPHIEGIHFNTSHSRDLALIAISTAIIGVDIEFEQPDFDYTDISLSALTEDEQAFIKHNSNPISNFYTIWTRKEALLKASGEGLVDQMNQVSTMERDVSRYNHKYRLLSLKTDQKYNMSIAINQEEPDISYWSYT